MENRLAEYKSPKTPREYKRGLRKLIKMIIRREYVNKRSWTLNELEYYDACVKSGFVIGGEIVRAEAGNPLFNVPKHIVVTYTGLKFLKQASTEAQAKIALIISICTFLLAVAAFLQEFFR